MGRPRLHDDATVLRLTDAAEALLAEGGVEAVSVRGVADRAGATTRAVYSVFGGKDGLVSALYRRGCARFLAAQRAVGEAADPFDNLMRLVREGFSAFARRDPHLYRLIFERPLPGFAPSLQDRAALGEALGILTARMQRVVDAGLAGGRDARQLALAGTVAVQGCVSAELNRTPPAVDDAVMSDLLLSLYLGWRTPPVRAGDGTR